MIRVLVLGNAHRAGVLDEAARLLPFIRRHAEVVHEDLYQKTDLSNIEAELTLVLGGDGAILRAARQMGYRQIPVLGINLGRLGFLADFTAEEFETHFAAIAAGDYRITEHIMFEASQPGGPTWLGLNDIAVQTGPPFHMLDLELFVDGENVASYSGDGLLISTPIGSTAHSLSAGGSILGQELEVFAITPICPHGLTSRPVVDDANKMYTIEVSRGGSHAHLIIDGQESVLLGEKGQVQVRRAPVRFKLARATGRGFYRTLNDKLAWGTQPNYRSEPLRSPGRTVNTATDSPATGQGPR
ncbi:MAG: NAD(+)/NADH kinase [Gemmataceae bacterium]